MSLSNVYSMKERSAEYETYPVAASTKIWGGSIVVVDTATGYAKPGAHATGLVVVGKAAETADNSAGSAGAISVAVKPSGSGTDFLCDNDTGGSPVTAAMIEQNCYLLDDHTVTAASSGASVAGVVKGLDASGKVWVRFVR